MPIVIPGRLSLVPQGSPARGCDRVLLADIRSPEFREGRYEIYHYTKFDGNGVVGPPALDQVLSFVHYLRSRLGSSGAGVAVEYFPAQRKAAAVLVGAYLVLAEGWPAQQVCKRLRTEARLLFPCSWRWAEHGERGLMSAKDCWEGLEAALRLGWIHRSMVEDEAACSRTARDFWRTIVQYDGSWLSPGKIFVMADPTTVIKDPNPLTCGAMLPPTPEDCLEESGSTFDRTSKPGSGSASTDEGDCVLQDVDCDDSSSVSLPGRGLAGDDASVGSVCKAFVHDSVGGRDENDSVGSVCTGFVREQFGEDWDNDSVGSVCKGFATQASASALQDENDRMSSMRSSPELAADATGKELRVGQRPLPLLTFFANHCVKTVLRTNRSDEPGLRELGGSYDADVFQRHNIQHHDLFVEDRRGSVPSDADIRQFLEIMHELHVKPDAPSDSGALAIHCKSGFGRSVTFACILLVFLHDVPGRALLGWSRIARPGAIISDEEERLLCSLPGRRGLLQRCGLSHLAPAHDGLAEVLDEQAAGACCSIQ